MIAEAQAIQSLSLELTRVFQATRENVFRAWIDREELQHWWGPKGFSTVVDSFDAKPGGA